MLLRMLMHLFIIVSVFYSQEQQSYEMYCVEQFVHLGLLYKHGGYFHVRGPVVYVDRNSSI